MQVFKITIIILLKKIHLMTELKLEIKQLYYKNHRYIFKIINTILILPIF